MSKMFQTWIPVLATMITGCATAPEGADLEQALAPPSADPADPADLALQPAPSPEGAAAAGLGLPDHCFATTNGNVVRLDLVHETITPTPDVGFAGADLSSLGLTQNHLVGCGTDGPVRILDLATGVQTTVDLPCEAATAIGDKIYVQSLTQDTLTEYADLRALIARQPARSLPAPFASRLGAGNGRLLASWHSTNEVLAVKLATGATRSLALPNYDGWIFGLFENAKVRMVAGGWVETGINLYDTTSGAAVGRLFDGVFLEGLACSNQK